MHVDGAAGDGEGGAGHPHRQVAGLGIATITAYGGWFYGFGVLLQAISDDTGWSLAALGGAFAAGQLAAGIGATLGGRLLDRAGARTTFLLGGVVGGAALGAAALAPSLAVFLVAFTLAAGLIGGTGFYHATMAVARRLDPLHPARTIGPLTIWGAFSSPLFLPLTAVLVQRTGWRPTLLVLAGLTAAGMGVGAWLAGGPGASATTTAAPQETLAPPLRTAVRAVLARPAGRRLVIAVLCNGVGHGMILTYQVPIMVATGLTLSTAASFAGARGLLQLTGRIGLVRAVDAVGARRLLAGAGLLSAVSVALLAVSGQVVVAGLFALTAGMAFGAGSPLIGIHGSEVLPEPHAGALMGALQTVQGVGSAIGPLLGSLSLAATDSYLAALVACGCLFLLATGLLWSGDPDRR